MAKDSFIEAVRNVKSGQLFILLGDSLDQRFKLLNLRGEILNLPSNLFEDEPVLVESADFSSEFTPEQLKAYEKFNEKIAAQIDRIASVQAEEARAPVRSSEPRSSSRRREAPSKTGLAATWNANRLIFYRHKIQGLQPKQSFRISVEGIGDFQMTKDDFLKTFNDVVMSPSYQRDGLFAYPQVPEKALRFKRA